MQIFQRNILNKYIESLDISKIQELYLLYSDYFLDPAIQENIHQSKEEQFQEGFLRELFVKILGYTLNPSLNYNLITEKKNEGNSKKADGAILVSGKVVGVIELKDHKTPDLGQIEAQAFGYKNRNKEAIYVVISNFEKLRFYIDNAVDFEEFDLFHLSFEDFERLWICLAYENIEKNLPKQIKTASLTNEDQITNALYKDYSNFKRDLFDDILKNNPTDDTDHKILLFKKTQKLLDRLLFIFFAEDRGLLPPNSIMLIIEQWEKLKELDEYQPFYNRLKKYFGYMNTGFQGKNYEVFAYNGGLFKPDEILDGLTISDDVLWNYCKKIADYDFASDVDVNILGHIFENSLTEIEEVTTRLSTMGHAPLAQPLQKRKKDGVFYTPQYITKYIVENTIGKLCREKKAEFGIDDSEYFTDKKRQTATKKALIEKLDAYREWLLQISICDPACGSGAFLNAALNFLIAEHKLIDEMSAKVEGAAIVFPNVENSILENNLYGVDINEESVEIAKLSLWLRTAKPHRKLNSLNNNIKFGNSLIDDPTIAGEKAFCWEKEFPQVFREKQKKAWHITTAVHDSRTSERMVEYEVRRLRDHGTRPKPEPMLLSEEEEIIITETVSKIVREDKLNLLAYNICFDHMHLLLVCEEEEVPKIVGKIKSMTARAVNIAMGRTVPKMETPIGATAAATRGHAPMSVPAAENLPDEEPSGRGDTQCPLWTQKFGNTYIDSEEHLYNAIQYIQTNREHHDLPPLPVEYPPCVSIEEAFRPEYTGGFDVVIGNPPYGASFSKKDIDYLSKTYKHQSYQLDSYLVFTEKVDLLVKENGYVGFIMPNTWLSTIFSTGIRKYVFETFAMKELQHYSYFVFSDATVETDVYILEKNKNVVDNEIKVAFIKNENDTSPKSITIPQKSIIEKNGAPINIYEREDFGSIKIKCENLKKLGDLFQIVQGTKPFQKGKGNPPQTEDILKSQVFVQEYRKDETYLPCLRGSLINRYSIFWNKNYYISYGDWLAEPRYSAKFETKEKLVIRQTGDSIIATYDDNQFICRDNLYVLRDDNNICSLKLILAVLNSRFTTWYYRSFINPEIGKALAQVKRTHLLQLPIPIFDKDLSSRTCRENSNDTNTDNGACCIESGRYDRDSDKGACPLDPTGREHWNDGQDRDSDSGACPLDPTGREHWTDGQGRDSEACLAVPAGRFSSELSELADQMLSLNANLQHKRQRFLRRLQDNLALQKVTTALEHFNEQDFKAFVAELKKQKISLSLAQQDEWEDYFNQYKAECTALSAQIAATDKEVDRMVYELYGLTEDEIKVVEGE